MILILAVGYLSTRELASSSTTLSPYIFNFVMKVHAAAAKLRVGLGLPG
jgi:hypothetical protein